MSFKVIKNPGNNQFQLIFLFYFIYISFIFCTDQFFVYVYIYIYRAGEDTAINIKAIAFYIYMNMNIRTLIAPEVSSIINYQGNVIIACNSLTKNEIKTKNKKHFRNKITLYAL